MFHIAAKGLYLLLVIGVCSGTGCDRAQSVTSRFGKEKPGAKSPVVFGPLITEISAVEMDSFLRKKDRLVILYYHALWSGQCRQLDAYFEKETEEYAGVVIVGKIDIDQFPALSKEKGVGDVPDVRFFREGILVDRTVGFANGEIIHAMIAKHAKGLKPPTGLEQEEAPPKRLTAPMPKEWLPPGVRRR